MVQYASVITKSAYMSGDFAVSYSTKLFGAEAVDNLPRISRGKRKGLHKGMLFWTKCTTGGWVRSAMGGHVAYPGFVEAWIEIDGKRVLQTVFSSFEKKQEAEKRETKLRADYLMEVAFDMADENWFKPHHPKMVDWDTRTDDRLRVAVQIASGKPEVATLAYVEQISEEYARSMSRNDNS